MLNILDNLLWWPESMSLKVVPVDDEVEVFEADQDLVSLALQSDPIKFWNWPQWFDQNHKIIPSPSLWSLIKTLPYCKINSHILLWNAKIYLPFKPSADLNALLWAESSLSGNDSLRFSWLKKGRFSSFKTEFPSPKIAFLPLNIPCVKDQMWLYLSALIHPVASCLKQVLLT